MRLFKSLFFLSAFVVCFVLGMGFAAKRWPPFGTFESGIEAIKAVSTWITESRTTAKLIELSTNDAQQIAKNSGKAPENEYILLSGGLGHWLNECPKFGCMAVIVDKTGEVIHKWEFRPDEIFDDSGHIGLSAIQVYPLGLHLAENGDLTVSFQNRGGFPFAYGIAKYSFAGELNWAHVDMNHHWFFVDSDGVILSPSLDVIDGSLLVAGKELKCSTGSYYSDFLNLYDSDGTMLRRVSMLELLTSSGYEGLISSTNDPCDPTHLNDVQVVKNTLPGIEIGNRKLVLLSFRNINAVAIVDLASEEIIWMTSGLTREQHSPRAVAGGIMIFDNYAKLNGSQIVTINTDSYKKTVVYPRESVGNFYSETAGQIDISSDSQRALVSETKAGKVLEILLTTGEVVWEYNNRHRINEALAIPSLRDANGKFARFSTSSAYYLSKQQVESLLN